MKPTCFKVIIILILVILISGCTKAIRLEEAKNRHNLIIVPFKASPVQIRSWGAGTVLLGGVVGAALVDGATKEGREKVVNTLNEISGQWDPSVVIAQECLSLINKYSTLQIEKVTIVDAREMPGTETMRLKEPKIFTSTSVHGLKGWTDAGSRFIRKSKSPIQYRQDYPQSGADFALEVFSSMIHIIKMKKIQFNVILKLVDTSSSEKIALNWEYATFPISLGKDLSDFKTFEDEFRNASRELCSKTLNKIGLILVR